ncbi:unnamed protein product [Soboliphyme baturini]|uniref:VHS domain-containing protein n=1 Tax=Soboliphyme baturini TaxID=241478 RepID=A0A183IJX2_9BILA|nr:unnamed protein product [Soboliphyme baturini]
MEQARDAAQAVSEFFQGNPFQTIVGHKIGMLFAVTRKVFTFHLNPIPREAIRAIRRRLQMNIGKNDIVVMYTLTVLETCVKNCDFRLHHLVSQKDFINDLLKFIGPKYDPPQNIQDRVLGLIKTWAEAFRGKSELSGVCEVYDEMKAKGIEFPKIEMEKSPPIFTPRVSALSQQTPVAAKAAAFPSIGPQRNMLTLTPEQLAKLRSELDVDLHSTCQEMQERIVDLIGRISSEEVTSELLVVNDEMNNVFGKTETMHRNRRLPLRTAILLI